MHTENKAEQLRRIQLRRVKGWRKPPNTIVVSRPSKWGNPFPVTPERSQPAAVAEFETWLKGDGVELLNAAKVELRGKNLACWCRPGTPCHADVLLRLVNP
jgi:hypothetical protein